jgi:hypothetical protein
MNGATRAAAIGPVSLDEAEALIECGRKFGVRKLRLDDEGLRVTFFPERAPEPMLAADADPDDEEKPVKRQKPKGEPLGAGLMSDEDARTLMDPYHDLGE